ncbi:tyrosine-protein phosphatase [Enterococcus sp. LJL120]
MTYFTRLPLKGSYNTRELGGYPTGNGAINFHKFIRSDSITALTNQDLDFLKEYGLQTIVDLRSDAEVAQAPNPQMEGVENLHIPLITGDIADATKDLSRSMKLTMGSFYINVLKDYPQNLVKVFEAMADSQGAVLFHCSAGKDRTGIIAAFLLDLAGVSEADIIANYQLTHTYLKTNPTFTKSASGYPQEMFYSLPSYMEELLSYLYQNYDSAENYLKTFGLSELAIENLREQLTGPVLVSVKED